MQKFRPKQSTVLGEGISDGSPGLLSLTRQKPSSLTWTSSHSPDILGVLVTLRPELADVAGGRLLLIGLC